MTRHGPKVRKVLLVIVDALASRIILPAMDGGRLPMFCGLTERGLLRRASTAIFPSITPAATASLITGVYPREHGVVGAYWYERETGEVAYYGDDFWVVLEKGVRAFMNDFLVKLNRSRLRAPTAFERLAAEGLSTGCLNYLWFRGTTPHSVRRPWWMKLIPGVPAAHRIQGPDMLALGEFVEGPLLECARRHRFGGYGNGRLGFNDESTACMLLMLARDDALPDFTVAYFPDNDFRSHNERPAEALAAVEQVDQTLGKLAEHYGGIDAMLEKLAIVITGDHSQSDLFEDEPRRAIELADLLGHLRLVAPGKGWGEGDQLMVCPNMRAVQVYFRDGGSVERAAVARALLADARIDQVIYQDSQNESQPVSPPRRGRFHVETADRGSLRFWNAGADRARCHDDYGNLWEFEGSLATIDARLAEDGGLEYGCYPNAMERIARAFPKDVGDLWATARPGSEFRLSPMHVNRRGSHGSLHVDDSTSPLLVAPNLEAVDVPHRPRSVDVLRLCCDLLEGRSQRATSQS